MGFTRGKQIQSHRRSVRAAFALPTVLIASIVMMIVLLVSVSSTASVRTSIKEQYYAQLAKAAGEAGIAYAQACIAANGGQPAWTNAQPLKPNTDCSGSELVTCPTTSTDALCSVVLNDNIRSSFSIGLPVIEDPSSLVVAGGGSGGGSTGGGGGGGGVVYSNSIELAAGSYPVVVGSGGIAPGTGAPGRNGQNSSFNGVIATGGGGGGYSVGGTSGAGGLDGGSGGGGQNYYGSYPSGEGITGQGSSGGDLGTAAGSGGGGAGGVGSAGSGTNIGGAGGPGRLLSISGADVYYGGGGGGGNLGTGGTGGGGTGSSSAANGVGVSGTANTGGGGGGGYNYTGGNGGAGGSGVVIVRYPSGSFTATGGTITTDGSYTVHRFTGSGTFNVTAVSNSLKVIPNTGYVELLRDSNKAVWRKYDQKSAPSSVVPDLCSAGKASSIYGWNNALLGTLDSGFVDSPTNRIHAANVGVAAGPMYYQKDFSVTQAGTYTLVTKADDYFDAFLDGNLVSSGSGASTVFTTTVDLTAGCHNMLVKVTNGNVMPNGAGLTMTLTPQGQKNPIMKSDSSWRISAGTLGHFSTPYYNYNGSAWSYVRDIQSYSDSTVWAAASLSPAWAVTSGDTSARWISTTHSYTSTATYPGNSEAFFFDRQQATLSTPQDVRLTYACDDICDIWVDGSIVGTGNGWSNVTITDITLSEGAHSFGATLTNGGAGAAGLLFAAVAEDGTVLSRSGSGWLATKDWYSSTTTTMPYSYDYGFLPNPDNRASTTARVLVVGGGGGGGGNHGGGGGAGGYNYNAAYTIRPGTYEVRVGNGGAGGSGTAAGAPGAVSFFDTIFAIGGGGGGARIATNSVAQALGGGSGGGGAGTLDVATGVAGNGKIGYPGIGNRGGNGSSDATAGQGGGGGGAGVAGGNASGASGTGTSGTGGNGIANTITGSSVYYAGGGSGGRWSTGTIGAAGLGGGGTGGRDGVAATSGTANTGGGGGGSGGSSTGSGAGGSGIVIISYLTGTVSATGGTITTSGGYTIHSFTGSGTFTVNSIP